MAGKAVIGALRVDLGLNSAQFHTGLKKASTGLSGFGKTAGIALAAVATAAVAAGVALGVAVKGAIDHADQLSKTSQKIGVTTEALSRLEWAAKLSDVSLEQLSTGLKKLSQNLFDVASGAGATAQRGFDALGISATNANGTLRSADEVLADVAEKFARMEDGTAKTAIAVSLFGRAGAELIPMLNMGKAGLADMAAEADRLGITISTKTGRAAEAFNDSLTRLSAVFQGVVNKVMEAVLPSLNHLGDMLASPQFAESAQQIGLGIVEAMKWAVDAINSVVGALSALREGLDWLSTHDMFGNSKGPTDIQIGMGKGRAQLDLKRAFERGDMFDPTEFLEGFGGRADAGRRPILDIPDTPNPFTPAIGGAKKLREEIEIAIPRVSEMQQRFIDLGGTIDSAVAGGLSGMVKAISKGEDAVASLAGAFSSLADTLIDMAADQLIQGLFGNLMGIFGGGAGGTGRGAFGRGTFGGGGGFFPAFPGFANGTMSAPGGMAWVGERGPELVNLPRGSQVIPNDALRGGGDDRLSVSVVTEVRNGNLVPVMTQISGQVAGRVVEQQAPAVVARAQRNRVTK